MSDGWTVGRVVRWAADDFRTKGIESPRLEAELLLAHALGTDRLWVIVEPERDLSDDELARYRQSAVHPRKGHRLAVARHPWIRAAPRALGRRRRARVAASHRRRGAAFSASGRRARRRDGNGSSCRGARDVRRGGIRRYRD